MKKQIVKKRKKWSAEGILRAYQEVKNGSSIKAASKKYGVPFTTLQSRISGKYDFNAKSGPRTYFSLEEENDLESWIMKMAAAGFPVTKNHLLDTVQHIFEEKVKNNEIAVSPFKNKLPSDHWYKDFLRRHPRLSIRASQNLPTSRANITEARVRKWFINTRQHLAEEQLNVADVGPERIFNVDESGFLLTPKEKKVIVRRGEKSVYNICKSDKECYTALIGGSATGALLPPMILFNNQRISKTIADNFPDDFVIGKSDTGWMTREVFFNYVANIFHPWLVEKNIMFPVIMYVDGHSSHLSKPLVDFCYEKKIYLVSLLPNATHLLQPMDVSVFSALKKTYANEIRNYRLQNNGQVLTKTFFPGVLKKALNKLDLESIISNGFRKCSLYPFSDENIDYSKIVRVMEVHDKESQLESASDSSADSVFMSMLESRIDKNILLAFKMNKTAEWKGDVVYKELYLLWFKNKNGTITAAQQSNSENCLIADDESLLADLHSREVICASTSNNNLQGESSNINITEFSGDPLELNYKISCNASYEDRLNSSSVHQNSQTESTDFGEKSIESMEIIIATDNLNTQPYNNNNNIFESSDIYDEPLEDVDIIAAETPIKSKDSYVMEDDNWQYNNNLEDCNNNCNNADSHYWNEITHTQQNLPSSSQNNSIDSVNINTHHDLTSSINNNFTGNEFLDTQQNLPSSSQNNSIDSVNINTHDSTSSINNNIIGNENFEDLLQKPVNELTKTVTDISTGSQQKVLDKVGIKKYLFCPEPKENIKKKRFNKHQDLPSVLVGKIYRNYLNEEEKNKAIKEEEKKRTRKKKKHKVKLKKK